ncbi:NAD(P)-dependent oxidoreductase [Deinococcus sp.]|uniref:NAD(P)-dependent oxidoreductase n=1 Tax=Deinococcus sp. TaxID=47478 RepID=UPI003CC6355E
MSESMNVAVLGLGAMGSRMAQNLLRAGHEVVVYNRSPEAAASLEAAGATRAATPRAAAEGADIVVSMVTDDSASRGVWLDEEAGALHGLGAGTLAIESSTLTPGWMLELKGWIEARGAALLDAPVVGSRPQAEAGQLIYLLGGPASSVERARPVLEVMGGTLHHVGEVGQGTALKLAVNALFAVQVAAVGELLGFLHRSGLPEARAAEVLGSLPVTSPAANGALAQIVARTYAPLFPIQLAEKDLTYVLDAAKGVGADLPTSAAVHDVFQRAVQAGYGADQISGVAQLFLK